MPCPSQAPRLWTMRPCQRRTALALSARCRHWCVCACGSGETMLAGHPNGPLGQQTHWLPRRRGGQPSVARKYCSCTMAWSSMQIECAGPTAVCRALSKCDGQSSPRCRPRVAPHVLGRHAHPSDEAFHIAIQSIGTSTDNAPGERPPRTRPCACCVSVPMHLQRAVAAIVFLIRCSGSLGYALLAPSLAGMFSGCAL